MKLEDYVVMYPIIRNIINAFFTGSIHERLSLQSDNHRKLSIIFNGPSLSETVHNLKRDETDVMMVNYAVETELYDKLQPEFICLADPVFFRYTERNYKIAKKIEKREKKVTLIVPNYGSYGVFYGKRILLKKVFTSPKLLKVDMYIPKLLKMNLMSPYLINVGILCIYAAIQMGYKNIDIYGLDQNYIKYFSVDEKNNVFCEECRFYGVEKVNQSQLYGSGYNMTYELQTCYETFAGFQMLARYADEQGVNITNKSVASLLDCYKKCNEAIGR